MTRDDDTPRECASPACLAHQIDPAYVDPPSVDPQQAQDVARWHRAERIRLLAERPAIPVDTRRAAALADADHLDQLLAERFAKITGLTVSVWWQLRAELDLRFWLAGLAARGARGALPLVVTRAAPLMFRAWTTDTLMERGFWNISVPAVRPYITLDITLAPSWAGTQPVTALDMAADISTAHLPRLHRSLWPSA